MAVRRRTSSCRIGSCSRRIRDGGAPAASKDRSDSVLRRLIPCLAGPAVAHGVSFSTPVRSPAWASPLADTGTTACLRRTTDCEKPSPHSPKGNVGKWRDAATGGHAVGGYAAEGCCDTHEKPRSHDTSRIAWAKLMARVGEDFPFACLGCGGDIRLIAFITDLGPIRKILTHLGEPLEPPPVSPARGPPTDWGELVQPHDDSNVFQATDRRAARDRYPQPLTPAERQVTGHNKAVRRPDSERLRADAGKTSLQRGKPEMHCRRGGGGSR